VLSKAHRKTSESMIVTQNTIISGVKKQLVVTMTLWIAIVLLVSGLYGWFIIKHYVDDINEIKQVLGILPVSVVRTLPSASRYIKSILQEN